jgi:hypothetical protein
MSEDEAQKALWTALKDDSGLTALIGEDRVRVGWPNSQPVFPFVSLEWQDANPPRNATYVGRNKPDLQINIYSYDPYLNTKVRSYLESNYTIPTKRPAGIESTNYRYTEMYHTGGAPALKFKIEDDDNFIHHLPSLWRLTVKPKSEGV